MKTLQKIDIIFFFPWGILITEIGGFKIYFSGIPEYLFFSLLFAHGNDSIPLEPGIIPSSRLAPSSCTPVGIALLGPGDQIAGEGDSLG